MFTELYSPLQQLSHPHLADYWIKRDDLIDPYISGNKWRKLKYLIEDMLDKRKSHLVTFGGAYSNHLVAAAAAACRSGFSATAFVRGESVQNEMLVLCSLFGMQLIFTDRTAYKDRMACYNQYFENDPKAYFIDEGGASTLAVTGCTEIISDLPENTTHIFCAAGTGTTAAGLLRGIQEAGRKTKLHVVPVLKNGEFIRDEIGKYTTITDALILHKDYHFGGYAKTKPELLSFMKSFITQHGILIDPVYTAKMFFAIADLSKNNYLKKEDKVIAIHTGGLLGIMGMKEKLSVATIR